MPQSSVAKKTRRELADSSFRTLLDQAASRVEKETEGREALRKRLEYRVKNSSKKEALKAQAKLKKEFGLTVYTKEDIARFRTDRAVKVSNVCYLAEESLKYFKHLHQSGGGITKEQQDYINEIQADISALRAMSL